MFIRTDFKANTTQVSDVRDELRKMNEEIAKARRGVEENGERYSALSENLRMADGQIKASLKSACADIIQGAVRNANASVR